MNHSLFLKGKVGIRVDSEIKKAGKHYDLRAFEFFDIDFRGAWDSRRTLMTFYPSCN